MITKFFNTAGPVNQDQHYKLDPLSRWDMEDILALIDQKKYFILHAPRQTGKTSSLLALRDYLNARDQYRAVYANFEIGQAARNNIDSGIRAIVQNLMSEYGFLFEIDIAQWKPIEDATAANELLGRALSHLSALSSKPFVLLIDEIDALIGDTLISVLRQLRSGYPRRPATFPQSVLLCGVRDIKDYRIHTSGQDIITGGSAFNIKAKSLTMGNFSEAEVRELYGEHTKETGQEFDDCCFPLVMELTNGQPWLVNALAHEAVYEVKTNRDPSVTITPEILLEAKERLILSRATHLDQLADKLAEDRVKRILEPILAGELVTDMQRDDIEYCKDLGLIRRSKNEGLVISNDIYREIVPRELTLAQQDNFEAILQPEWVKSDGTIDSNKLLTMFRDFWRENSDIWGDQIAGYTEAAPHLVFQAFLQRVANGNGSVLREYALGTKRVDLMLQWKHLSGEQRIVIELKVLKKESLDTLREQGLEQTADYARRSNADEAHLIIFDRADKTDWKNNPLTESTEHVGQSISIWGMK